MGTFATTAAGYGVGQLVGGLPQAALGGCALVTFVAGVRIPLRELPQSAWRVPRPGRFPDRLYPLVFGFSLGTGVMTALPAVSFYLVVLSFLVAASFSQALVVAFAFAAARSVPLVLVAVRTRPGNASVATAMAARARVVDRAMRLEPSVLLLIAVAAFAGSAA